MPEVLVSSRCEIIQAHSCALCLVTTNHITQQAQRGNLNYCRSCLALFGWFSWNIRFEPIQPRISLQIWWPWGLPFRTLCFFISWIISMPCFHTYKRNLHKTWLKTAKMSIEDFLQGLSLPVTYINRVSWYSFFLHFLICCIVPVFSYLAQVFYWTVF